MEKEIIGGIATKWNTPKDTALKEMAKKLAVILIQGREEKNGRTN